MRRLLMPLLLLLLLAAPASAQQETIYVDRLMAAVRSCIGCTTFGATSPFQVVGLPTLAGSLVTVDGSGNIGIGGAATAPSTLGVTGAFSANGNVTLGDGSSDAINFSGRVNTTILWNTDNLVDIGASGANRPRHLYLAGNAALDGNTGTTDYASRTTGWRVTEPGAADFRSAFTNVFQAQQFEVDMTSVIAGTQIVSKSASTVSQAFTCPATGSVGGLWVKDKPSLPNARVFAAGDHVSIQTAARTDADSDGNLEFAISDCVGVVTSYADGTSGNDGQQSWAFTRGISTGGAGGSMLTSTVVPVDSPVIDYGTPGMGIATTTAVDGTEGANAPYLAFSHWATSPITANFVTDCRLGNLSGAYGYSSGSGIFGLGCGPSTGTYFTIEATNGLQFFNGATKKFWLTTSGAMALYDSATTYLQLNGGAIKMVENSVELFSLVSGVATFGRPLTSNDTGQIRIDSDSVDIWWRNSSGVSSRVFYVQGDGAGGAVGAMAGTFMATIIDTATVRSASTHLTLSATSIGSDVIVQPGAFGEFRPYADNTYDFGTSSYAWSEIFADITTTTTDYNPIVLGASGQFLEKTDGVSATFNPTTCTSMTFHSGLLVAKAGC